MARTRDPVAHAVRRDAFVDAGLRLITEAGYEQLSLAEVIDDVGASKGAFYHYFDSKSALLDAVVERMVELAVAELEQVVTDPDLTARRKLTGVLTGLARFKARRKELVLAVMEVWFSDDNTVVREHLRRATARRLTPLLAAIVRQGVAEGDFDVRSVEGTADVLVALLLGANETASRLFLARQAGRVSFAHVKATLAAYGDAFERVLGLPAGSVTVVQTRILREWYG